MKNSRGLVSLPHLPRDLRLREAAAAAQVRSGAGMRPQMTLGAGETAESNVQKGQL